jgi:ferredoxin
LSGIEERRVGDLTIQIDRLICVGFGDCVEASPDAFSLDEEGIATLLPGAASVMAEELIAACRTCPVDAFVVLDPDGNQLVP